MRISEDRLRQIESDLGLNIRFSKGTDIKVKNCWHFCTDGNAVDFLFDGDDDFKSGMNRIYKIALKFNVIIFAFCLMDTHIHFILYGSYNECNRFMHEYIRLTSYHISVKYGDRHKLCNIPISHQEIDTDRYLKTAICYVIKNPPVGGLPFTYYDYPWSSGSLYFRREGYWSVPYWRTSEFSNATVSLSSFSERDRKSMMESRGNVNAKVRMIDGIVFPGEYVATEVVEQIYKSSKGYNYFLCVSKESDVESRGGSFSRLSLPMSEMRQKRDDVCRELFGDKNLKSLNTSQRVRLARTLKNRHESSVKQIARLCGLRYDEVKSLLE